MGGSNDPDNLISLTVEEHAEAHRKLYEEYGCWQDFMAWKALSGQIKSDDIRRVKTTMIWTGRKHTEESKEKIREARKKQKHTNKGMTWSDESRKRQSEKHTGKILSEEHKLKIGERLKGKAKPTIKCPHCNKEGGIPQMRQWHFDNCKLRK